MSVDCWEVWCRKKNLVFFLWDLLWDSPNPRDSGSGDDSDDGQKNNNQLKAAAEAAMTKTAAEATVAVGNLFERGWARAVSRGLI